MNTTTQIENALKAINQASFQTLINHLLYLQGNKYVGAPGAAIGKEKTSKGTPDSYFVNEDKYIFVECTTQEKVGKSKSFFDKLSKDIDHCFKEDETTISKEKIEKVILACNEKVGVEDFNLLKEKVKSYNSDTEFELITIQSLSYDLFEFPKLTSEYLDIQIVKGDIYSLKEFLLKTEKGLQPSLTNKFIGRKDELKNCLEALEKYDILFLSGGAGVGKSKLAVQILEELEKKDYIPIVIQSSGVSLWDDYQHLFSKGKQHIILFDDANKSINNLNYLLSKLEDSTSYTAKIIITSRDYVKKQVSTLLDNYSYKEFNILEFKDEEINEIIVAALPNLQYHDNIKRKIIDLARGNARVALMATYSVTPDSETNYLSSPVLLYEKYFIKISEELHIFKTPIILKSLAIVSFFGILDRNNEELKNILSIKFNIDWNDLWSAIMELHDSEILDVYSDEIVKVSDQVLATYAFYKCFIDEKSGVVNYSEWIKVFMEKHSHRIRTTLIDVNNTFDYYHVKELVLPHLNEVIKHLESDKDLYDFYNLFWFYKGRDCLLYLKKWIGSLQQEQFPEILKFSYDHNAHTTATKHFELLRGFWNHPNELFKPSLELTLELLNKEPSRLAEILKFIHEDFKYKIQDLEHGYLRQNLLFDVLLNKKLDGIEKSFANGIFLNLAEVLLGWHYTEYRSTKGNAFTFYNFNLYKSDELMRLRERILNQVYHLFESKNEQVQKVLNRIIYSGGKIDKSIYIEELSIYQKLISEKLDNTQYAHCKFVSAISKHLTEAGEAFPENWNDFIESDIRKLSMFLKSSWEYRDGKSFRESEEEKKQKFDDFVKGSDWKSLQNFLLNIDTLYKQQNDNNTWQIEQAVTDIYYSIARKDRSEFDNALRLFFSDKVSFPLRTTVLNVALLENILTAKELLGIINDYEFQGKLYWKSELVAMLPEDQVDKTFLILLIDIVNRIDVPIYIHRMLDYLKYEAEFEEYKNEYAELEKHNIITYLTNILLTKKRRTSRDFGFNFCVDCTPYFSNHINLLKEAYWAQYELDSHFDYEGKELKAILDIDKNFINESIKRDIIGFGYSSKINLKDTNLDVLWDYEEYESLIEEMLLTILEKAEYFSFVEDDVISIFQFNNITNLRIDRVKNLVFKLTEKYSTNKNLILAFIEIVYSSYRDWFLEYFKFFLTKNKDIEVTKNISFGRIQTTSGSWVPVYQKKIEFYEDVIKMLNTLPNILDYSEHLDYFEQKIIWKKKDIEREQKRDFMDEYY